MKLSLLALGLAASLWGAVKSLASSDFNPGVTLRSIYSDSSCVRLSWHIRRAMLKSFASVLN